MIYPMLQGSWYLTKVALQLLAEERVGVPRQEAARAAKARENAGFDALRAAVGATDS